MTNTKRNGYKIIALLTSIMILLSGLPVYLVQQAAPGLTASAVDDETEEAVKIREFRVDFLEGAEQRDEGLIWTATTVPPGHKFIYYIHFSLAGKDYFAPGEIEITVPIHMLKNRIGQYADDLELSVPLKEDVESYDGEFSDEDNQFQYVIEGDTAVITNHRDFSAATTGYIELAYVTNQTSYEYRDMRMSDEFSADIRLLETGTQQELDTASDTAPAFGIDTYAKLGNTEKKSLQHHTPISSWNRTWGPAPADADDYYYLMWEIKSYVGDATQPYTLTIDDTVFEGEAEPVAYRFQGESRFTSSNTRTNIRVSDAYRYDYVITRHAKSVYQDMETYTIKNKEIMTLTPIDEVDDTIKRKATASFTYYRPHFSAPGEYVYSAKWGNNNWHYRFNYYWEIADYGLQDLKDGEVGYLGSRIADDIKGNIKYYVETRAYVCSQTLEEGADREKIENYGKRKVNFVLTDDRFFLNDHITVADDKAVIDDTERRLTYEDYDIDYVDYYCSIADGRLDEEYNTIVSAPVVYKEDDIISFYAKFGNGDWIKAAEYNLYTNQAQNVLDEYVSSLTSSRIVFRDNCVAYRIEMSNGHYATHIDCYPYIRVKNSAYVLAQSEGVNKIQITNVSNYTVTNDKNEVLHDKDSIATDYIIGVQKESTIKKEVAFTTGNSLRRFATVGWRVEIDEHYMTNEGIVYIPQDTGVFYDLLPIGNMIDTASVAVGVDYNNNFSNIRYLKENDFEVSAIVNYKNTGRTLLAVRIKEQFRRAMLTYNTIYTWDSAMDYGTTLLNTIAFETGNDKIAGGYPDNGGDIGIEDKEVMTDLDPDTNDRKFIYEQKLHPIRFLISTRTGLVKTVNNAKDIEFSGETAVGQKADYIYKLRYNTTIVSRAKDMVLYDSLENFVNDGKESEWHGILQYVDVNQPERMGIAPVVYYSEKALDINVYHDIDNDEINGEKVWKTADEFGDISRAKAIAVDMRHDEDGNDFILDRKSSVVVNLYMKSPNEDTSGSEDPVAFNNIYIYDTVIDIFGDEEPYSTHHDCTTVHFRVVGDVLIEKYDSKNTNTNIKDISFKLSGTSDYGTVVNTTMTTDSSGRIKFRDIEKGTYTLREAAGTADYLPLDYELSVIVQEDGSVLVNNLPVEKGVFFRIPNDPRVHADISFIKKNLNTFGLVGGAKFRLQGTSFYYPALENAVILTRTSDENGEIKFENVEWGEYTLREVEAPEGYALSSTVYKVTVDSEGLFTITVSEEEGDGDTASIKRTNSVYSIYNEPLHSFTIQKLSSTTYNPVRARYKLTEQSTGKSIIKTTGDNGRLSFEELASGLYGLEETEVLDEGYNTDSRSYLVTIEKNGTVTIEEHTVNNDGSFVFLDSPNGSVTVIKKWDDNETTESRLAQDISPVINISSDISEPAVYIKSDFRAYNAVRNNSTSFIKSFAPYSGDSEDARYIIENGKKRDGTAVTIKRMDDDSTDYYAYAWDDTGNGNVVWYSNAVRVYMQAGMWAACPNIVSVDTTGLDTSLMTSLASMFQNCYNLKTLDIKGFDTFRVINMGYMFLNCGQLEKIEFGEKFDTSRVLRMDYMFYGCSKLANIMGTGGEENITGLDVSRFDTGEVMDMRSMFNGCSNLEFIDVSGFDTSRAVNMNEMFSGCTKLKNIMNDDGTYGDTGLDVSGFDTSMVTNMRYMFYNCYQLQFIDVSGFDTEYVVDMSGMFFNCIRLRNIMNDDGTFGAAGLDVSGFKTQSVNDMHDMFRTCRALQYIDVSGFDTARVYNMSYMFSECSALINAYPTADTPKKTGLDISGFDTGCVTDMQYMFRTCSNLEFIDIGAKFSTEGVTNMEAMFRGCTGLVRLDIRGFRTYRTGNMKYMFAGCENLLSNDEETTLDFSGWETSRVIYMEGMFNGCQKIEKLNVGGFDTSRVESMNYMFYNCKSLKSLSLDSWTSPSVTNMEGMFNSCSELGTLSFGTGFDASSVSNMNTAFANCVKLKKLDLSRFRTYLLTDARQMFGFCKALEELDLSGFYATMVEYCSNMFQDCFKLKKLIIPNDLSWISANSFSYMFINCQSLEEIDISNWQTSTITNMESMFSLCTALKTVHMDNIDTSGVTGMTNMFYKCTSLVSIDLSMLDTSSLSSMEGMFNECTSLRTVKLSGINTPQLTSLKNTFYNCRSLEEADLTGLDTHRVKDMSGMFQQCSALTKIKGIEDFDTSNLATMANMFYYCSSITEIDLSSWYVPKLTSMTIAFYYCTNLETIKVSARWKYNNPNTNDQAFTGCRHLIGQQGTLYSGYHTGSDYAVIDEISDGSFGYFTESTSYNVYPQRNEVYFRWEYNTFYNALSNNVKNNLTAFRHYTGSAESVQTLIDNGTAKLADDDTTGDYHIYVWVDGTTLYWWSNADNVYIGNSYKDLWNGKTFKSIDLSGIDFSKLTSMRNMFGCINLESIDLSEFDSSNVRDMSQVFWYGYNNINIKTIKLVRDDGTSAFVTSRAVTMQRMFSYLQITTLDLSCFDTSNVRSMRWMFYNSQKLAEIKFNKADGTTGFDTSAAESIRAMFSNCQRLTQLDMSGFDTSKVRDMSYLFEKCYSMTDIKLCKDDGTTAFVTDNVYLMNYMFSECRKITQLDLHNFNTSKAIRMDAMFYDCEALTSLDISSFDTSGVLYMNSMFKVCRVMTELKLGGGFDTSKVRLMNEMFSECNALEKIVSDEDPANDRNVGIFDTSGVWSMASMFNNCNKLQELDVSGWDTSKVQLMNNMFYGCSLIKTLAVDNWDTSRAQSMAYMFSKCKSLQGELDLTGWDTSQVNDMQQMFAMEWNLPNTGLTQIKLANEDGTTKFDASRVRYMDYMFYNCRGLTSMDLSDVPADNVTQMRNMFSGCMGLTSLRLAKDDGTTKFNTSQAMYMYGMFTSLAGLESIDLSGFDTSHAVTMRSMFSSSTGLKSIKFANDDGTTKFDTSRVNHMLNMFNKCSSLEELDLSCFDTSNVVNSAVNNDTGAAWGGDGNVGEGMFRDCTKLRKIIWGEHFDTSRMHLMDYMFCNCSSLTTEGLDLSSFDTSSVLRMDYMFWSCTGLTELDVSRFDTSRVWIMSYMFDNCTSLTSLDLSGFDTSRVTNMEVMFYSCTSLKSVSFAKPDGTTKFDTSRVTSMYQMFYNTGLEGELDLSVFNTPRVNNMQQMFCFCTKLTGINFGRNFKTHKVTTMQYMFQNCQALTKLDLSGFDTSRVTNMTAMFYNDIGLQSINFIKDNGSSSFDVSNVESMYSMFYNCRSLTELDLSSFSPVKVTSLWTMFSFCRNLERIYVSSERWHFDSGYTSNMFEQDNKLTGANGTTLASTGYKLTSAYAVVDTEETPGYLTEAENTPELVSAASRGAAVIASYTSYDDVCSVEYRDDKTWIYTFSGIDTSVRYYAWEDFLENYSSKNMGKYNALEVDDNGYATILNTTTIDPPSYGSLRLEKVLAAEQGAEITDFDEAKVFKFNIIITDENGAPLSGTALYGDVGFLDGKAAVYLKGGEYKNMTSIPAGYHYEITEAEYDEYITSVTGTAKGIIEKDTTAEVVYTNTKRYHEDEEYTGYFTLVKTVTGNCEDKTDQYVFGISLTGLHKNTDYQTAGGTEYTSDAYGKAQVTVRLRDGESERFELPEGAGFRISEDGGDKYTAEYTVVRDSEIEYQAKSDGYNTDLMTPWIDIDKDNETVVTYINTRNIRQPLVLRKTVEGGSSASSETFGFTAVISGLAPREAVRVIGYGNPKADDNGVLKMELSIKAGTELTFTDLPVGAKYKFTENKSDYIASYKLTNEGSVTNYVSEQAANHEVQTALSTATETVNEGEEVTVTFTNTKVSHDVTVKKAVDMTYGTVPESRYSNEKFRFVVALTGLTAGEEYTVICDTDISHYEKITAAADVTLYEIYLKAGQSFTIKGLPEGAKYRITESAVRHYISSYEAAGNTGAVIAKTHDENTKPDTELKTEKETVDAADLEVVYSFRNTYSASDFELPAAGLPDSRPFTAAVITGMLLFGAAYLLINRRRKNAHKQ